MLDHAPSVQDTIVNSSSVAFLVAVHFWQFPQYYHQKTFNRKILNEADLVKPLEKQRLWVTKKMKRLKMKAEKQHEWMNQMNDRRARKVKPKRIQNPFPCFLGNGIFMYRSQKRGRGEAHSKQKNDNKNDIYHTMECVYHSVSNACLLCRKVG